MPSLSQISLKEREDICGPRSEMILSEVPCRRQTLSKKSLTKPSESKVDVVGAMCLIFPRLSVAVKIESKPLQEGRPVMRSVVTTPQNLGVGSIGLRAPCGFWFLFFIL